MMAPMRTTLPTLDMDTPRLQITLYEEWNKIVLNGHSIPFTPTESRLCCSFLQEWSRTQKDSLLTHDGQTILSYLNATELQARASLASKQLLRKHISNTNGKLAPFHLHITACNQGYLFIVSSEPPIITFYRHEQLLQRPNG